MFYNASSFNQPLNSWDVSSVTDMSHMFWGVTSFNQNISAWDVSSVTNMSHMFYNASSFNGDISAWDVSSVTNMTRMLDFAASLDQNLGSWYVVIDSSSVDRKDIPGMVGTISARNPFLDGQNPTYQIEQGGDSDRFEITDGNHLIMVSAAADRATLYGHHRRHRRHGLRGRQQPADHPSDLGGVISAAPRWLPLDGQPEPDPPLRQRFRRMCCLM